MQLFKMAATGAATPARTQALLRRTLATGAAATGAQPLLAPTVAGVVVGSVEDGSPVASVAIVFKAGSRYDPATAPGTAHLWQSSLVRATPEETIIRSVRGTELRGDSLYTSLTREHLVLASDFMRDDLKDVVPFLLRHAYNTTMQAHEFLDSRAHAVEQSEAALASTETQVFDRLHQVAFRNGLGNPLFATAEGADALNRAKLQAWAKVHFNPSSMVVVGRGVDHAELKGLVEEHVNPYPKAAATAAPSTPPTFHGGQEARLEAGPESESCVALAYPGPSAGSADFAAGQVLRALLDGAKHSPRGSAAGVTGLLAGAATPNTTSTAFHTAYSDAGLLGFHVHAASGAGSEVQGVLSKSITALKAAASPASIHPEALTRAKKGAIIQAEQSKTRADRLLELASAALAVAPAPSHAAFAAAVEKVTAADVARVAATVLKAKPSMVSSGNLRVLPHLDQL